MNDALTHSALPQRVRVVLDANRLPAIRRLAKEYSLGMGVRKNSRIALALFLAGAKLRDAESAWYAADAFEYGLGTSINLVEAEKYLKLASRLGSAGATTALGEMYWSHAKSDADRRKAIALYRRAGRRGEPHALHNIGVCHSGGVVLRKSPVLAFKYFLLAAESGHIEAAFKVGWCFVYGEGTIQSTANGRLWLRRAARSGHREAKKLLASREIVKAEQ